MVCHRCRSSPQGVARTSCIFFSLGTCLRASSSGSKKASRRWTISSSILLTVGATATYVALKWDGASFPFGVKLAGNGDQFQQKWYFRIVRAKPPGSLMVESVRR